MHPPSIKYIENFFLLPDVAPLFILATFYFVCLIVILPVFVFCFLVQSIFIRLYFICFLCLFLCFLVRRQIMRNYPDKIKWCGGKKAILPSLKANNESFRINPHSYMGLCTYYVITFGGPERPLPPPMYYCNHFDILPM